MILKVYSIRDSKGEIFNIPFFSKTHGEAERQFRTLVNDSKSQVNAYPEDFDLYYVGEYDDNEGKLTSLDTPQHMIKAVQCLNKGMGSDAIRQTDEVGLVREAPEAVQ
jgi:hypothetical protein